MAKQFKQLLIAVLAAHSVGGAIAEEHGHMHHAFPKDIDAFHAVLAPVWHARPGMERSRDACSKADQMEGLAKDIRSRDASALVASVAALKQQCQAKPGEIDGALHDVHEAFHRLIDGKSGQ